MSAGREDDVTVDQLRAGGDQLIAHFRDESDLPTVFVNLANQLVSVADIAATLAMATHVEEAIDADQRAMAAQILRDSSEILKIAAGKLEE